MSHNWDAFDGIDTLHCPDSCGLLVALGFHGFVVLYEEPHLRRMFGRQYEECVASVGRWLPRWPRRRLRARAREEPH